MAFAAAGLSQLGSGQKGVFLKAPSPKDPTENSPKKVQKGAKRSQKGTEKARKEAPFR